MSRMMPVIVLLKGEYVNELGSGYDEAKPIEEAKADVLEWAKRHLELNKVEYDTVLIGKDAKIYKWQRDFAKLNEIDQWMVRVVVPDFEQFNTKHTVQQIVGTASVRMKKAGFREGCTRCGGSGHFSRCDMYGTICFKCGGHKFTLPKLKTKKVRAEIEAKFSEIEKMGGWSEYQKTEEYKSFDYTVAKR